jgi:hypothetical protein
MDLYYTHLLFFVFCSCSQLSCICILRAGQPVVEQDHASGGVMFSSPAWHFHTVCVWEVFSDGIMYTPSQMRDGQHSAGHSFRRQGWQIAVVIISLCI